MNISQQLKDGLTLFEKGQLANAETCFLQVIQVQPEHADALHALGVIALKTGKYELAQDFVEKAIRSFANRADFHNTLGEVYRVTNRPEQAITSYTKANSLNPDNFEAHKNLGQLHQKLGNLELAKISYESAINLKPDFAQGFNMLGVICQQLGDTKEAISYYEKALSLAPDFAQAKNNLGISLQKKGETEKATVYFREAIKDKPDYADACNNLGLSLKEAGKMEEAQKFYEQAILINPGFAVAHNNLGNVLVEMKQDKEAIKAYREAIRFRPDYTDAYLSLAHLHKNSGNFSGAIKCFEAVIQNQPELAEVHHMLGDLYYEINDFHKSLICHRHAVNLEPENELYWHAYAIPLGNLGFNSIDGGLLNEFNHLLSFNTIAVNSLNFAMTSAIRCLPSFKSIMNREKKGENGGTQSWSTAKELASIPVFLRIMELSCIIDPEIENLLSNLRRELLLSYRNGDEHMFSAARPFCAALALHCFTNEYVYEESKEESNEINKLAQEISLQSEKKDEINAINLALIACYRALYLLPWSNELDPDSFPDEIKKVLTRQVHEPLEELKIRETIPNITSINDDVSREVRNQYEENPNPRWVTTSLATEKRDLKECLLSPPYRFNLKNFESGAEPKILVAGCGTGQHPIVIASKYANAHILAIDLSLSSLSYAIRKSGEFGLDNIEYAQADILELENLNREFDLIESSGVLHHLEDPLAGWRVLLKLLRPNGLMKIALYSDLARSGVHKGRAFIADREFQSNTEDIRRCRKEIFSMVENGDKDMAAIVAFNDFYSLSECRDLLFHVQEYCFTLPEIEQFAATEGLRFLGFELKNNEALQKFRTKYPLKSSSSSLQKWHDFEKENPDTFKGMYQCWFQKRA